MIASLPWPEKVLSERAVGAGEGGNEVNNILRGGRASDSERSLE
jgi:hypothetical protein